MQICKMCLINVLSNVPQQDQYAFIHDALSDYITCGDTSVIAHELQFVIGDMEKKDEAGQSGFVKEFEVEFEITLCIADLKHIVGSFPYNYSSIIISLSFY